MDSTIIQVVATGATVGALGFTAYTFLTLRKTDQFKLVDGLLKHLSSLTHQYNQATTEVPLDANNQVEASYEAKLFRMRDGIYGYLNWISYLVLSNEIKEKGLARYFENGIVEYYENFFIHDKNKFPEGSLPHFKRLYEKITKHQG